MSFKKKEQITFFLTTNCNLKCVYCYMPKMNIKQCDKKINIDFCVAGMKDFFAHSKSRCIRFFSSGEPTLAFEEMVTIYNKAYELVGDELKVELETNGIFTKEIADWIAGHVDYLWISCDGDSDIQSIQRPSKWRSEDDFNTQLLYNNIQRFAKENTIQFGVRATISENNYYNQIRIIDFFKELGVQYVCASPTYPSKPNSFIKPTNFLDFAKGFLEAYNYALQYNIFYQTLFMVNFDEETDIYCQASIPTPRLTTDGYVSCCDWAAFGPEYFPGVMQQCIYGFYDSEAKKIIYSEEKIKKIQQRNVEYLSQHDCKGCRALKHCAGGCLGKVMSQTNNMFTKYQPWCDAVLYLYDNLKLLDSKIPVLHP